MKRSMHFFWPRAESNLYAEPKRLVEAGLATAEVVWNGDRKRTLYSITEGATALRRWLAEDPALNVSSRSRPFAPFRQPRLEGDLHAAIGRVTADAEEWSPGFRCWRRVRPRRGRFPERIHVNALLVTLMVEQARTALRWAAWAKDAVDRWADAATPDVEWAVQALRRVVDAEPFSAAT